MGCIRYTSLLKYEIVLDWLNSPEINEIVLEKYEIVVPEKKEQTDKINRPQQVVMYTINHCFIPIVTVKNLYMS